MSHSRLLSANSSAQRKLVTALFSINHKSRKACDELSSKKLFVSLPHGNQFFVISTHFVLHTQFCFTLGLVKL